MTIIEPHPTIIAMQAMACCYRMFICLQFNYVLMTEKNLTVNNRSSANTSKNPQDTSLYVKCQRPIDTEVMGFELSVSMAMVPLFAVDGHRFASTEAVASYSAPVALLQDNRWRYIKYLRT